MAGFLIFSLLGLLICYSIFLYLDKHTCSVFFTIRIASLINGAKFVGPDMRIFGVISL
jgi:hypothetical protein